MSCRLLKELAGASGFEPPTSWSRTLGRPILQAFAAVCKSPIHSSFHHFLNDFQTFRFAPVCTELSTLVAREGQEKGKVSQVIDSWFTHHCRPRASRCGRTSHARKRAETGDREHPAVPRPRKRKTGLAGVQGLLSPCSEHPIDPCRKSRPVTSLPGSSDAVRFRWVSVKRTTLAAAKPSPASSRA